MATRLLYLVDRPIQYQAPLLRRIGREPGLDLQVVFRTDAGSEEYFDAGFQTKIRWDLPLREGYRNKVLRNDADLLAAIADSHVLWLHGWHGPRMWRALGTARRLGLPVLMRGENTLSAMPDGAGVRGIVKRCYLKWIFARCAAFLCVGTANRDYYRAHGVESHRLFSVPYAVDNDFFRTRAVEAARHRATFRAGLNLQPDRPVILFAGKLQKRKHPLALLAAFRQLDRGRLGQPYLLFVGDGELRAAIVTAAQENDYIRFFGFRNQTEMPAFYDLADVFVLPAEKEPWGLAVNEAMNAARAVIVSDECGCHTDLVDDSCGMVIPTGDPYSLAYALACVLASPDQCRAMGRAAAAKIQDWNFEACVQGLKDALAFARPEPPLT
jgi:glycosyltransferase involved in cell wall biosynthesis